MISTTKTLLPIAFLSLLILAGCAKEKTNISQPGSELKEVSSVSFKKANGDPFAASDIQVTIKVDSVLVKVPNGTELNGLTPEFGFKGKSISPASGVPQNFNFPVKYTITAENGSKASYTVAVNANPPANNNPDIVYFGSSDNNFYAVNAATGQLVWKYTGTKSFVYSSATYNNGVVYVGGIDDYVYAFDALTGNIKWTYKMGTTGIESDAVYADGSIYVGCNDDYMVALDAATGQFKWSFMTGSNISASPTVANGTVYFGSSDGKLYALSTSTGQLKWAFPTGAMINQSGPALVDGVIYVGSRDSYLYAIDATTGTQKWRYSTNGISLEQSSPTVANGIVYIGGWYDVPGFTKKGSMYAVNATNGALVWEKLQNTGISSSPTVANGKLYITTDDLNIYALDAASGSTIWSKQVLANSASPAVSNGVVYVGGGGTHYFYAFDAATGTEKWRFSVPNGIMTSSPLIISASNDPHYSGDSGNYN
jgi:eukaryotic-like serine/threonine-protein kinase